MTRVESTTPPGAAASPEPLSRHLYVQVLAAIALGVVVGALFPATGAALKPLGDAFIALVRMMIAPIVFCTVVHGIGSMRDMARVGRIGLKAIVYFEAVSTLALLIGLTVAHIVRPGVGLNISPPTGKAAAATAGYIAQASATDAGLVPHVLHIIPRSFFDAFAGGDLLQVLLVAVLTGLALTRMGEPGAVIARGVEQVGAVFFRIIGMIVHLAPIGAFGAMAYTVGAFGLKSLVNLGQLVGAFDLTSGLFIVLVLGGIAAGVGFSIFRLIAYLREELLLVLGTSSSETALPGLIRKMERLGASEPVVGLVVPTGYSFNLDGTNIYMTLAIIFLAQATNTPLTFAEEAEIFAVAMLTSKGASGVTGAGFVTLAATLAIAPQIPIASLAVLLGVDRFMSECRSITNFLGNAVATLVVSRWEGDLDREQLARALSAPPAEMATAAALAADDPPVLESADASRR